MYMWRYLHDRGPQALESYILNNLIDQMLVQVYTCIYIYTHDIHVPVHVMCVHVHIH